MSNGYKVPKAEEGLPPCPHCSSTERYRLGSHYARCLKCGKTFGDIDESTSA